MELGTVKCFKFRISITERAKLQFHRPYQLPFVLKEAVERELEHLEKDGALKEVDYNEAFGIACAPTKFQKWTSSCVMTILTTCC